MLFILLLLLNTLFARETIVQINSHTYQITNATFYNSSSEAEDPKSGFRKNTFYQNYVRSIQETTPWLLREEKPAPNQLSPREKFDTCILDKLRMRFDSKRAGKSIPFNSLEASTLSCHSQQFSKFNVIKKSSKNEEELLFAEGENSIYLEDALLMALYSPSSKKIVANTFGAGTCLYPPYEDEDYCNGWVNPCNPLRVGETSRNWCFSKVCEEAGKFGYINLFNKSDLIKENPEILAELALPASQFAEIMKSIKEETPNNALYCVKCPRGSRPDSSFANCIDKEHGCNITNNEIYLRSTGKCEKKNCEKPATFSNESGCASPCRAKCDANIKILKEALEKPFPEYNHSNPISEIVEVAGPHDKEDRVFLPQNINKLQFDQIATGFRAIIQSRISLYEGQKKSCRNDKSNYCYGTSAEVNKLIENIGASFCKPNQIYSHYSDKCIKQSCLSCAQMLSKFGSLNSADYLNQIKALFPLCGQSETLHRFNVYVENLRRAFQKEWDKCEAGKTFQCNPNTEITQTSFMEYLTLARFDCHLQSSPNSKSKSVRGGK